MAKKPSKPAKKTVKSMTADDHRKLAEMHHAKGSLHSAKAQLLEAQNSSQKKGTRPGTY
jgi:hypothetical protein